MKVPVSLLSTISLGVLFSLLTPQTYAQMIDKDYQLDTEEIGLPQENQHLEKKQPNTSPLKPQIRVQEKSYQIRTQPETISFWLSDDLITFGIITATSPVIRDQSLRVSSPVGYTVFSEETNQLHTKTGALIPDTTCDNGQCTSKEADKWTNTLTYGFGYRCDGKTCDPAFQEKDTYKSFSQKILTPIMHTEDRQEADVNKLTYKVNISGTQPEGSYTTTINYIIVPTF